MYLLRKMLQYLFLGAVSGNKEYTKRGCLIAFWSVAVFIIAFLIIGLIFSSIR